MHNAPARLIARIKLWLVNTFIAALLVLVAGDALPFLDGPLRVFTDPAIRLVGRWAPSGQPALQAGVDAGLHKIAAAQDWLGAQVTLPLHGIGLNQGAWNMFSPNPDNQNHRIRAEVQYKDGSRQEIWRTPTWRKQSAWERFVYHRESEFSDGLNGWQNSAVVRGSFARYLIRRGLPPHPQGVRPKFIVFIIETHSIAPPPAGPWAPEPDMYEEGTVLEKVPVP